MTRLRDVLRRDVVALHEGISLGRPSDIVIDPDKHRVAALVLSTGAVPEVSIVCSTKAIHGFEGDVTGVDGLDSFHLAYREKSVLEIIRHGIKVRGRTVLTNKGERLGRIAQVHVDSEGRVVQYMVRRGFWGWLLKPTPITPAQLEGVGEDVAVLKETPEAKEPESKDIDPTAKAG